MSLKILLFCLAIAVVGLLAMSTYYNIKTLKVVPELEGKAQRAATRAELAASDASGHADQAAAAASLANRFASEAQVASEAPNITTVSNHFEVEKAEAALRFEYPELPDVDDEDDEPMERDCE